MNVRKDKHLSKLSKYLNKAAVAKMKLFSQQLLFQLVISVILVACHAEWIEITQNAKDQSATSRARIQKTSSKPTGIYETIKEQDFTTPSVEWIQYQRERFANVKVNKLTISSAAGNLKNSAKIVVPANVQVFQTKTKLDVKSTPADVEVVVTPKVETTSRRDMTHEDEEVEVVDEAEEPVLDEAEEQQDTSNQLQFPSMQGFLNFLRKMQNSWLKKSAYSIEQKINLLKQLRDNLMRVIEHQFNMLWLSDDERHHRQKRGILDESNLNFPPEAALMTINFLTFAVFLIKLVLVVHIVKSKHYKFTGFNITTETVRKSLP